MSDIRNIKIETLPLEVLNAVLGDAFYNVTRDSLRAFKNEFSKNSKKQTMGLFINEALQSLIAYTEEEKITLDYIGTKREARKKGYARILLNNLQILTAKELYAETDDDVIGFYRAHGFEVRAFKRKFGNKTVQRYKCRRRKYLKDG